MVMKLKQTVELTLSPARSGREGKQKGPSLKWTCKAKGGVKVEMAALVGMEERFEKSWHNKHQVIMLRFQNGGACMHAWQ